MTKWAVWLPMCVLFGAHLVMLVAWPWAPFENLRLRILLAAMDKFGFAGNSFALLCSKEMKRGFRASILQCSHSLDRFCAGAFLILFAGPFLLLTIFAVIGLEVNKRIT